ncbi:restriction endonuclease [Allokutzneria sp. A3M-2-11 16]|uniref:restriction endonuclease n=1 Tax=Allokutzneria sp. A3M-2-11 16 TaxID=2962043 RepID=UPI0020B86E1F|nr:restriction endonuclease [Allokutzneria sp. A3M-2-11 16]MCP3802656.1 restriction endonuclease [Allokutzneria sp. A3M-2-11 16]
MAYQREQAERRERQERERAAREAERAERARQRAAAQANREMQAAYVRAQQEDAAARTEATRARVAELEGVLTSGASSARAVTFDQLRKPFEARLFSPGRLIQPAQPPYWQNYQPAPPSALSRLFSKTKIHQAQVEARARFEAATERFQHGERQRLAALAQAEAKHASTERQRRGEIDEHNRRVDELERGVRAKSATAVEDYCELLIELSRLPEELPIDVEVAYQPDARKLLVIRELPDVVVIPGVREFSYVRSRDETVEKPRPQKEIRQRYADLVAQLVLRTMRDAFQIRPAAIIDEVAVNGHVSTRNKATGRPERPCLVSVSATRAQFEDLVLTELDPAECLRHLSALVSPHPWDLEAIRPIFDPDLSKYRFVDAHDAAAGLDSRQVLLEMAPIEFEHLVRQLFEAMGMRSWVTQASRDDGVDAVAVNEDPIMGGVCVVQAKRYSGIVPADAVRALAGVMDDKRASRGVLVTTSWFGKATHDFSARHGRIQLIEGPQLKHLIAEHLGKDIVIGELKRRTK